MHGHMLVIDGKIKHWLCSWRFLCFFWGRNRSTLGLVWSPSKYIKGSSVASFCLTRCNFGGCLFSWAGCSLLCGYVNALARFQENTCITIWKLNKLVISFALSHFFLLRSFFHICTFIFTNTLSGICWGPARFLTVAELYTLPVFFHVCLHPIASTISVLRSCESSFRCATAISYDTWLLSTLVSKIAFFPSFEANETSRSFSRYVIVHIEMLRVESLCTFSKFTMFIEYCNINLSAM